MVIDPNNNSRRTWNHNIDIHRETDNEVLKQIIGSLNPLFEDLLICEN